MPNEIYPAVSANGVDDDTAPIMAALATGKEVVLPPGVCRITSDIFQTAPPTGVFEVYRGTTLLKYSPGPRIRGSHMLGTTILADYDGDAANGAILRLDTATPRSYMMGCSIKHLGLTQAPGRTGLNGIQLTAAWLGEIDSVFIHGLSGDAVKATWRPDLSATLSDVYQSHALTMKRMYLEGNAGWGFNLGAGQSPGVFRMEHNLIRKNAGGGIRSTTGHCEIIANNLQDNGTHGLSGSGALLFDTVEGPQFVAKVEQNEFDNNFNWHMSLKRSRRLIAKQNRFLSGTYESATSMIRQSGSAFMRPYVHVSLGSGPSNEVVAPHFEMNYHRTVTGPDPTTASVIAYTASGGAVSLARMIRNDLSYADGVTQNSSGLTKYAGFPADTTIVDP
jgi:hypothetical protein